MFGGGEGGVGGVVVEGCPECILGGGGTPAGGGNGGECPSCPLDGVHHGHSLGPSPAV